MYSKHSKPIGSEGTLEKVSNMYMIVSECFMDLTFCLPQCKFQVFLHYVCLIWKYFLQNMICVLFYLYNTLVLIIIIDGKRAHYWLALLGLYSIWDLYYYVFDKNSEKIKLLHCTFPCQLIVWFALTEVCCLKCLTDLYLLTGNDTISCSWVRNPCWKGEKYIRCTCNIC